MQAQDVQNAIAANDNTKKLMDIPKFYSNAKETLTAHGFIDRLEQAAKIGNWNNNRKCAEFCHLMHSEANGFMTTTLKKAKIAENDWARHKEVFLSFYDVKGTAKLNIFSLHKMKQSPTEKVRDFWTKVQLHMDRIKDLVDVQEQIKTLEKQDFPAANVAYDALKVAIATETLILDKKDNLKMTIKIMAVEAECGDKVL